MGKKSRRGHPSKKAAAARRNKQSQPLSSSSSAATTWTKNTSALSPWSNQSRHEEDDNKQGGLLLFRRYKEATNRFKTKLQALVPDWEFDRVQDFVHAVDYIDDHPREFLTTSWEQILTDLRLAIAVRRRYAKYFVQGGMDDEGHAYFLTVLNYCHCTLKKCSQEQQEQQSLDKENETPLPEQASLKENDDEETKAFFNRFSSLQIDEGDDDLSDDKEQSVARPEEPDNDTDYTWDEFTFVPDSAQAHQFLDYVTQRMTKWKDMWLVPLKEELAQMNQGELDADNRHKLTLSLLGLGQAFNIHLRAVRRAEKEFMLENPYLPTSYHIMAVAFFEPAIFLVTDQVMCSTPLHQKLQKVGGAQRVATDFVAEIVKIMSRTGEFIKVDNYVRRFAKQWKVSIMRTALVIARLVLDHCPTKFDCWESDLDEWHWLWSTDEELRESYREFKLLLIGPWQQEEVDAEKRLIINTFKVINGIVPSLMPMGDPSERNESSQRARIHQLKAGCEDFDENTKPVEGILHETDGWLPEFLELYQKSWWNSNIGEGGDFNSEEFLFLPLLSTLKEFVDGPGKSVSFACAFGFHAVVESIFAVQGSNRLKQVAETSESIFNLFYTQVMSSAENVFAGFEGDEGIEWRSRERLLITMMLDRRSLQQRYRMHERDMSMELYCSEETGQLALWNPLCASMFLGHLTFTYSLVAGTRFMDQNLCRITLHLFHALKEVGLLPHDLPVVSVIEKHFSYAKGVWGGWDEKPKKGEFSYRLNLAIGANHTTAKHKQKLAAQSLTDDAPIAPADIDRGLRKNGQSHCMQPTEYSKSYVRALQQALQQESSKLESNEQRKTKNSSHCKDILDDTEEDEDYRLWMAINEESALLRLNLIAVATAFREFNEGLPNLDGNYFTMGKPTSERDLVTRILSCATVSLSALDECEPDKIQEQRMIVEIAKHFKTFFGNPELLKQVCFH